MSSQKKNHSPQKSEIPHGQAINQRIIQEKV
jgi:hypothetical protein